MGFLSKAFKSVVKAFVAPTKAIWKGIKKVGKAVWKGVKKVLQSKVFKIGMLILSVVTAGMALVGGYATFSVAMKAGEGLLNSALAGGNHVLQTLTGGMAGKLGNAVKGTLGMGQQAATSLPQTLAQAGPASGLPGVANFGSAPVQAADFLQKTQAAAGIAQVGETASIGQSILNAPSRLVEAFSGYAKRAMDFVSSPIESIEKAYNAAKSAITGAPEAASGVPIAPGQPGAPGAYDPTGGLGDLLKTGTPAPAPAPSGGGLMRAAETVAGAGDNIASTGIGETLSGRGWKPATLEGATTSTTAGLAPGQTGPAVVDAATKGSGFGEMAKAWGPGLAMAGGQALSGYAQGQAQERIIEEERKAQEARDAEFAESVSSGRFEKEVGGFTIDLDSKWTDERRFPPEDEGRFRSRFSREEAA